METKPNNTVDIAGRKLEVGQRVIYLRAHWSKLLQFECEVVKFNERSVRIEVCDDDEWDSFYVNDYIDVIESDVKLVIINW